MLQFKKEIKKDVRAINTIPESWDDSDLGEFKYRLKENSFSFKFFIISLILFLITSSILAFSIFRNYSSFSEKQVDISITGPASMSSGQIDNFNILVLNKNPIPILESYIVLEYNAGKSVSGDDSPVSKKVYLGNILSKSSNATTVDMTLFGAEADTVDIKATLFYKVSGSNADFNKSISPIRILLKSSTVTINVNSLDEFRRGSINNINIKIKNNTNTDLKNILVLARAPSDFVYASSSEKLYNNNPSWIIDNLPANSEKSIDLYGKLTSNIGEIETFTFFVGTQDQQNPNNNLASIYSKTEKKIKITGQYLDVSVLSDSTNGEDIIYAGNTINLDFSYKNNLDYPIDDVVFVIKIDGPVDFDNSYAIMGAINKSEKSAIWDKSTMAGLALIGANNTGKFSIKLRVLKNVGYEKALNIKVYAQGKRASENSVSSMQDISLERKWTIGSN